MLVHYSDRTRCLFTQSSRHDLNRNSLVERARTMRCYSRLPRGHFLRAELRSTFSALWTSLPSSLSRHLLTRGTPLCLGNAWLHPVTTRNWSPLFLPSVELLALEKTLESPLDCKEIKPVNCKGNQSWIFIGRTDAEAPILWPPDAKNWITGKDPDAVNDWGQEEKGTMEDEMVGWHHWLNGDEVE